LGHGAERALAEFELPPAQDSSLPDWAQHLPLPLGLLSADKINTVSRGYAQEILTPAFGAGLEEFLQTRAEDIHGILNGLDMDHWDPESDPSIFANFESGEFEKRRQNKLNLLEEMDLEVDPERPLLAMINRMDYQKGVDLVPPALRVLPEGDWQVLILGTGDPELEQQIRGLDQDLPQVRSVLRYDETLARWMYAGADMMIIPSRYEPCGLTQMIAMRYGCVPVARATGGLKDTIGDYDEKPVSQSTGFLFQEPTYSALATAIWRALEVYRDKRRWRGLQRRGMKEDFSWERSAREYWSLYKKLLER
jgi:starch synthase